MGRWCVMLLGCSLGCVPRVSLPPLPPAGAPYAERQAAFERSRLVELPAPVTSLYSGQVYPKKPYPFVRTGAGAEVWHPGDLAALLPPESRTAVSAAAYEDHVYWGRLVQATGIGLLFAGVGLMFSGSSLHAANGNASGQSLAIGGGVCSLLGVIVTSLGTLSAMVFATEDQQQAWRSYSGDLRDALGL